MASIFTFLGAVAFNHLFHPLVNMSRNARQKSHERRYRKEYEAAYRVAREQSVTLTNVTSGNFRQTIADASDCVKKKLYDCSKIRIATFEELEDTIRNTEESRAALIAKHGWDGDLVAYVQQLYGC